VPSSKTPVSGRGAAIATAAERTRSAIEDLQSRLSEVGQQAEPSAQSERSETEDELERQLHAYFSGRTNKTSALEASPGRRPALEDLRRRVVDRVAERILEDWERSHPGTWNQIREEVMERLVDRVLRELEREG
jgi:hypothetical protein